MSAYTEGMQEGWKMGVQAVMKYVTYRMANCKQDGCAMRELDLIQDFTRRLIDDE